MSLISTIKKWDTDKLLPLETENAHERDKRVAFFEDGHYYLVDGKRPPASVTKFIAIYHEPFITEVALSKMRPEKRKAKYDGMSNGDIQKAWKANTQVACENGTTMHRLVELGMNKHLVIDKNEESKNSTKLDITTCEESMTREMEGLKIYYFNEFKTRGIIPYRTEWSIFMERGEEKSLDLAGQIDFIGYILNPDGSKRFVCQDWKRSKEIKTSNKWRKMFPPFDKYDDCNYIHYSIQIHLYCYILKRWYGISVDPEDMHIVCFHPNYYPYKMFKCEDVSALVKNAVETIGQKDFIRRVNKLSNH